MSLNAKRVVVTGALGALGRAVVGMVGRDGARVVAIDSAAATDPAPPGAERVIDQCDIGDPGAAGRALLEAARTLGGIDGLVNLAGTFRWETVATGHIETWDYLYRVNVRTAVVASQAALPYFPSTGGRIVNVGAMAAARAAAGMGAYAASKSAVARLTEALADELRGRSITVNAVLPSTLDTPQNRLNMPDADFTQWVCLESLAGVIGFLLSDASGGITGASIPVTGHS